MVDTTFWDKMGTKTFWFMMISIILIELAIFYKIGHLTMAMLDAIF